MAYTTLIEPEELANYLADPQWVIFDCRFTLTDSSAGRRAYTQGDIPGAYSVDLNEDLSSPITSNSGRHPLPSPDTLADKLGACGGKRFNAGGRVRRKFGRNRGTFMMVAK